VLRFHSLCSLPQTQRSKDVVRPVPICQITLQPQETHTLRADHRYHRSPSPVSESGATTDAELVQRAMTGDDGAFRQIVERYADRVAATVTSMLGRGHEADDVGQETFIRLHRSLSSIRGDSSLGTYLTRIAINLCLDATRRQKRWRFWYWDDESSEAPPFELTVENAAAPERIERKEFVQRAIQALDPKHRAVVVLRMIDGYSTKETAEMLKIPVGTVLSRLSRAQEQLRTMLKPLIEEK
jgi:RNA polymerase sigma-70 factor, ECF subfamily